MWCDSSDACLGKMPATDIWLHRISRSRAEKSWLHSHHRKGTSDVALIILRVSRCLEEKDGSKSQTCHCRSCQSSGISEESDGLCLQAIKETMSARVCHRYRRVDLAENTQFPLKFISKVLYSYFNACCVSYISLHFSTRYNHGTQLLERINYHRHFTYRAFRKISPFIFFNSSETLLKVFF
jgi:hypothetical protein